MTIGEWLAGARQRLTESGCPDPKIDSAWIAEDVLGMSAPALRFEAHSSLEPTQLARMTACLERRVSGEPIQYILQRADFMGLRFYVDRRVLIPRQDTEPLVENAVIALRGARAPQVLDLCCGSGAIGISIKTLVPNTEVTLADVSADALDVARHNARALNAEVTLRHGDLFRAVGREKFDLIACNPPYIRTSEMDTLQKEVRFEPALALDGGQDGLELYRRIAQDASAHMKPNGRIYLEVGDGEARDVLEMLKAKLQPSESGIIRDLNGIERIVWARS